MGYTYGVRSEQERLACIFDMLERVSVNRPEVSGIVEVQAVRVDGTYYTQTYPRLVTMDVDTGNLDTGNLESSLDVAYPSDISSSQDMLDILMPVAASVEGCTDLKLQASSITGSTDLRLQSACTCDEDPSERTQDGTIPDPGCVIHGHNYRGEMPIDPSWNDATVYHGDANDDGTPVDREQTSKALMSIAQDFYPNGQCLHGFDIADCPCLQGKCDCYEPFGCCAYMPELPA